MQESKYWQIEINEATTIDENHPAIQAAASLIKDNEVVAFPTETVYGLGANALSAEAVQKIFTAKGRPADNPLIIHIADIDQVKEVALTLPEQGEQLFKAFAPGPLTLILQGNGRVSGLATAGLPSVGVRIPNHPIALALIKAAGLPIAAPSANQSGRPSPTLGDHVWHDLKGKIAGLIDGGETGVGVESTVLDLTVTPPMLLRPGGISREAIEAVIGSIQIDPTLEINSLQKKTTNSADQVNVNAWEHDSLTPRSPGMKYTHYAPQAPLWLVDGTVAEQYEKIIGEARQLLKKDVKVGILTTEEGLSYYDQNLSEGHRADRDRITIRTCGKRQELSTVAHNLYKVLREFDQVGVDIILAETFPTDDLGQAIMNRLWKASGGKWLK